MFYFCHLREAMQVSRICSNGNKISFTVVVKCGVIELVKMMARKAQRKAERADSGNASVRASISFPREVYQTLEEIARLKKVSLSWVVRDAAEKYVADKWPLFKGLV
jgi:hypothetical protein